MLYVQNQHGVVARIHRGGPGGTSREAGVQGSDAFKRETVLQNQAFPVAYAQEMIRDQAARSAARLANQTSA